MQTKKEKISYAKELKRGIRLKSGQREVAEQKKQNAGITLIALVVTMIVRYDKNIKCCNIKGFLRFGYKKRWAKTYLFLISY